MIKRIVDTLRGTYGYAGVAIYRGDCLLFYEGWDPGHAGLIKKFYDGMLLPTDRIAMVIRGYTVTLFMLGGLLVACRSEGRFTPLPPLPDEEPEYTTGLTTSGLMARDEARKEAEAMLKALMSRG